MIAPGTIIGGDFRILQPLSEGGMGAVYIAEQISTGRRRAIKLMKRELVADAQLRARFALEAKAGAQIASEHVVEVLAAGITDEGQPWLAMELLSGQSLHDLVGQRGRLDLSEARTIMAHLCHAIAAAHRVGIVHRDLKPENVFVTNPQREGATFMAKVLDFGIAKVVAESQSAAFSQTASIGTPLWMAPEQADPRGVITPATDLWPIGLIAFFMLTGKPYWLSAHTNASVAALVREIAIENVAPASARAAELGASGTLPAGFDAWFAACVQRNPAQRFRSIDAAKDAFFALQSMTRSPSQSPMAKTVPHARDADVFAPTAAVPAITGAPTKPKRSTVWQWVLGITALFVFLTAVGFVGCRKLLATTPEEEAHPTEYRVSKVLSRAELSLPAKGGRAGDLLRLEKTDAWWGAELPLVTVVFFCALTEPTCAVTARELDALVADEEIHAQVRWRHAVRTNDASGRLAAEAAQGAFETGGTRAFLRFRDAVFAHHGAVTIDDVREWAKGIGVPDPDDYVIRLKRGEWKGRVDADVAAYAAARIGSPGFVWTNCEPRGLTVGDARSLRDDVAKVLIDRPRTEEIDLGQLYIARCKPSERPMLALTEAEVSPFAAVGSAEWAKKIALDWATALPSKRERSAKEPQPRSAIASAIKVTSKGDGYVVELTRAERSSSSAQSRIQRVTLGIRSTPDGWAVVEEAFADDASCAGALVAAVLQSPAVDPLDAAGQPSALTVVEHEVEGTRVKVTIRELTAGRSMGERVLGWDLATYPACSGK